MFDVIKLYRIFVSETVMPLSNRLSIPRSHLWDVKEKFWKIILNYESNEPQGDEPQGDDKSLPYCTSYLLMQILSCLLRTIV